MTRKQTQKAVCPYYVRRTRERLTCHCKETGHTVTLSGLGIERIEERYTYACCDMYGICPINKYLKAYEKADS